MSCVTLRIQVLTAASATAFAVAFATPAAAEQLLVVAAPGASAAERIEARSAANVRFAERLAPGIELVTVGQGTSVGQAIEDLGDEPAVRAVERNRGISATGVIDPLFSFQWGLRNTGSFASSDGSVAGADIDVTDAWELSRGAGALIAVTDTGIDTDHPDVAPAIAGGWDYLDWDDDPEDLNGHGTHVAGVAAAREGNGIGVAGIAPAAGLLVQRVLDNDGDGDTASEVQAFDDAADQGARVVNASFGSAEYSEAERQAIAGNPDTLFVTASGNNGVDVDRSARYPCALQLPNLICVGASTASDKRASFSNYGRTTVDIFAPGKDIASTWTGGGYALDSGTSMAAPAVAATAALIVSRYPDLGPADIKAAILTGADTPPALAGLSVSGGRLDARGALDKAASITPQARRAKVDLPQPDPIEPPKSPVQDAQDHPAPVPAPKLLSIKLKGAAKTKGKSATLTFKLTGAANVTVALQMRQCKGRKCKWVQQRKLTLKARGTSAQLALRSRTPKAGTWRVQATLGSVKRTVSFKVGRG